MKILFLAAEATPFVKVGGLADVAGELPFALRSLGAEVRVVLPFYTSLQKQNLDIELLSEIEWTFPPIQGPIQLFLANKDNHQVYLLQGESVRRVIEVYSDPAMDADKFTFLGIAALEIMKHLNWQPDILHAHDWHMAPSIAWLAQHREADPFYKSIASLLTIHNLPYMGVGGESALQTYGIRPSEQPLLPDWARSMPLPVGLASADWINTVSPSYAQEIQTSEFGCGLEGFLKSREDRLIGILNGIDNHQWDPASDPMLPVQFSHDTLVDRRKLKLGLQDELNLERNERIPLLCVVSRLDYQKGIDIVLEALGNVMDEPWQFILLGTGDKSIEVKSRLFGEAHSERVRIIHRFDPALARKVYAGSDMILIPSRYEPCGLAQMIAMRYGCVPVVSAVGGLKDTVCDYERNKFGTGFVFHPVDAQSLTQTLRKCILTFSDQRRWRALQLRGMKKDFSWDRSAREYLNLYDNAIAGRKSIL